MNGVETVKNGLEFIKDQRIAFYKERSLTDPFDDRSHCEMIDENIKNLINTNDFMTMTINRCIDYTKVGLFGRLTLIYWLLMVVLQASKGIKLDPRMETIYLFEVLKLPCQVMKDMQSRIAVNLLPLPAAVCSHIMTDKQWLQENLFCLISNAVKYSGEGTINVITKLTTNASLPTGAKRALKVHVSSTCSGNESPNSRDYFEGEEYNTKTSSDEAISIVDFSFMFLKRSRGFMGGSGGSNGKIYAASLDSTEIFVSASGSSGEHGVSTDTAPVQDMLLFEVEDTGIGLSDEMMNSLFTPFKQVIFVIVFPFFCAF
jgi:signal transduction histidine kinase